MLVRIVIPANSEVALGKRWTRPGKWADRAPRRRRRLAPGARRDFIFRPPSAGQRPETDPRASDRGAEEETAPATYWEGHEISRGDTIFFRALNAAQFADCGGSFWLCGISEFILKMANQGFSRGSCAAERRLSRGRRKSNGARD